MGSTLHCNIQMALDSIKLQMIEDSELVLTCQQSKVLIVMMQLIKYDYVMVIVQWYINNKTCPKNGRLLCWLSNIRGDFHESFAFGHCPNHLIFFKTIPLFLWISLTWYIPGCSLAGSWCRWSYSTWWSCLNTQ